MSISSAHIHANTLIPRSTYRSSAFGRMFPKLAPWTPPGNSDAEKEAAVASFSEDNLFTTENADNDRIPAGYTYFGQFVDHDITFDPTSSLQRQNDPNKLHNFRTPRLDLDCVYGEGPHDEPFMYDQTKADGDGFTGYLLSGKGRDPQTGNATNEDDLPRNGQGRALIGDMRNDENTIVAQIQLAFLKFHNRVLEALDNSTDPTIVSLGSEGRFHRAQTLVRWTYQYVVWNDWVRRLISNQTFLSLLERRATPGAGNGSTWHYNGLFYKWRNAPYIPVEFSVAAYRFGHSIVRPGYQVNTSGTFGFGKEFPIFPFGGATQDLRGFGPLRPEHSMQWDWFFDLPSTRPGFPQASQKIDMKLAQTLFHTPAGPSGMNPLATLNILRNWRMQVPSGTDVARAMGEVPIQLDHEIENCLWLYVLKEATVVNKGANSGTMMGPVGGRIIGEVFAGLLFGDSMSYVRCEPAWTPEKVANLLGEPGPSNGDWEFADILIFAGVQNPPF